MPAVKFLWFCQFPCFSSRICHFRALSTHGYARVFEQRIPAITRWLGRRDGGDILHCEYELHVCSLCGADCMKLVGSSHVDDRLQTEPMLLDIRGVTIRTMCKAEGITNALIENSIINRYLQSCTLQGCAMEFRE